MNTFPVTVENVSIRHVGRFLGFILGILITGGMISSIVMGLRVVGTTEFLRSYNLSSVAFTVCLIAFGVFLLLPRRQIRSQFLLRFLFGALAVVFSWRCVAAIFTAVDEGLTGSSLLVTSSFVGFGIVIAVWNVSAVLNRKGEQDGSRRRL